MAAAEVTLRAAPAPRSPPQETRWWGATVKPLLAARALLLRLLLLLRQNRCGLVLVRKLAQQRVPVDDVVDAAPRTLMTPAPTRRPTTSIGWPGGVGAVAGGLSHEGCVDATWRDAGNIVCGGRSARPAGAHC